MKRSQALAPLSRDHHQALVVARALARASDETAGAAASRFVAFIEQHELAHFAVEESVLLPVIPASEPGERLGRQMRDDHAFLRDAMRRLRDCDAVPDAEALRLIGQRLREHVQMEERRLFPYLERVLSEPLLERIGSEIEASAGRRS